MKFSITIITICIMFASCRKTPELASTKTSTSSTIYAAKEGPDDDVPIIIEQVVDNQNNAILNTLFSLFDGQDSLMGYTDSTGSCKIRFPHLGWWQLYLTAQGYVPVNAYINLTDSITQRKDTMVVR